MTDLVQEGALQLLGLLEPVRKIIQERDALEPLSGCVVKELRFMGSLVADAANIVLHWYVIDRGAGKRRRREDYHKIRIEADLVQRAEGRLQKRLAHDQRGQTADLRAAARNVDKAFDGRRGDRRLCGEGVPRRKKRSHYEGRGADSRSHQQHHRRGTKKRKAPRGGPSLSDRSSRDQISSRASSRSFFFFPESAVNSKESPALLSQEPASFW